MDEKWNLNDILDLSGRVIIVTGGNSGLGFESVKALASKKAAVILACRDAEKGEEAKRSILAEFSGALIDVMTLDLADLSSVRRFASVFAGKYPRLDVLLNNAGVMMCPYEKTQDGFERQFGTNHLGHFALTGLLLDVLRKTPGSRVVNVSSGAHAIGKMDFDNLMFENGDYGPIRAYGRSKLANLLFTYELDRRLKKAGIETISVAAHPGVATTNLSRHLDKIPLMKIFRPISKRMSQSAADGALPQIRASVDPGVRGGEYYGPRGRSKGDPVRVESNKASHDTADAERLWEISEQLVGISYLSDKEGRGTAKKIA
jgi:NAD(P)-dependent dehydrogenase (short-subunit alcohol dehydrogenase family)